MGLEKDHPVLQEYENGIKTKYCDFSEQGMQDNGVADLDVGIV